MTEWSPAKAIRAAREAMGLGKEELAERLGPGLEWYNELERDDAAAFTNISLAHLTVLATVLDTSPRALLVGPAAPTPIAGHSFRALATALQARAKASGLSVEELSDRVGWPLSDALEDSEDFWNLTVEQLQAASADERGGLKFEGTQRRKKGGRQRTAL